MDDIIILDGDQLMSVNILMKSEREYLSGQVFISIEKKIRSSEKMSGKLNSGF